MGPPDSRSVSTSSIAVRPTTSRNWPARWLLITPISGARRLACRFGSTIFGASCRVLTLDKLIAVKRAAGRPKDFEAIAELETLRDDA